MLNHLEIPGFVLFSGIGALLFAGFLARHVIKKDPGSQYMLDLSEAIHKGSLTFLNKEYRVMIPFAVVVGLILFFFLPHGGKLTAAFISGCLFSSLASRIGMYVATKANVRTTWACRTHLGKGLKIAFHSGVVVGLTVVGLAVLGITGFYLLFEDPELIFGFGFGASYIALFARVGGGIFTKAADVGADLVGKLEKEIPEDDPRNPAVIADNVGDNVGDVAGMSADLFESYVESLVSAMVIGFLSFSAAENRENYILLPLLLAAVGIFSSMTGTFFVRTSDDEKKITAELNMGILSASLVMTAASFFVIKHMVGNMGFFWATLIGLFTGIVLGLSTEYFTSPQRKPTMDIVKAAKTGAATVVLQGLAVGMWSTLIPVLAVSAGILSAFSLSGGMENFYSGLYGIAIAAVGMLSTLGITLASDSYGPVADNAAGIAEMAGLGKEIRKRTEALDEVGNTTAAVGKGFAIGSAALTSLVLFVTFAELVGLHSIDVMNPSVLVGVFIGGLLPFLFVALLFKAVGKAAIKMVNEVRRQFTEITGLMEGESKPDYEKCIEISTLSALKEMILPGVLAILSPILVGILLGAEALGGLLVGKTVVGFLMAVFLANAGGAWDNAKKYIEEGHLGGKGSEAHKAAIVGDTVGDPSKDTAGPALNILIKLMGIVALVFVPLFI